MRVAVVGDHAGVAAKAALAAHLRAHGHDVLDLGTDSDASVDYPDFAEKGARAVSEGRAERGAFVCGSGIGVCMTANKVPGVRAAVLHSDFEAEMSRRHNDANVACFGARTQSPSEMARLLDVFLATPFDGGRHAARVAKISALERQPPVRTARSADGR